MRKCMPPGGGTTLPVQPTQWRGGAGRGGEGATATRVVKASAVGGQRSRRAHSEKAERGPKEASVAPSQ